MALAVETKALTKVYRGKIEALKGVDLQVPRGAAFGLLGPNGAGKSTLVKALLSIVRPTAGTGKILGNPIEDPESRRGVGYLPEGHRFPQYLTGRGVCRYFGQLSGLGGDELEKDVDEKLEIVGMKDWADTKVSKYSKGMAQRVGLAQAMLGKPKLVFLDEPTDGVDPVGRHHIRQVIKDLCKGGTTVFLNSHLLLEVEQICEHVAIMHHGRILQQGSIDEIRAAVRLDRSTINVRFSTSKLSKKAIAAVEAIGKAMQLAEAGPPGAAYRATGDEKQAGFEITLEGDAKTTEVIDALRAHEVRVYAVEPSRPNLEDAFIDLISSQEDQSVGAERG